MRGCGRIARPAFPAPSSGRKNSAQLGRTASRDGERASEIAAVNLIVIASGAKQSIEKQRKCGLLRRFAPRKDDLHDHNKSSLLEQKLLPSAHDARPQRAARSKLIRGTESAPMPAVDANRHVDLAHHDGLAVAHVAGVALD